jgi:FKBP-type peptidyl-prolyl cis-trans isomerase
MSEKRKDPDDGKAYTFEEMSEFYKGKYKKKEILAYWEEMTPVKGKKAKAKAKEKPEPKAEAKAKPEPKAKAKTKAKAKAKAKAEAKEPVKRLRIGDKIPDVSLDKGFPPEKVPLVDFCKGKKVVLVGLPGAFTPT